MMIVLIIIATILMAFFQFILYFNKDVQALNNQKLKFLTKKSKIILIGSYISVALFALVYVFWGKENIARYGIYIFSLICTIDILIQYFITLKSIRLKLKFVIIFTCLYFLMLSTLIVGYFALYGFNITALLCYIIDTIVVALIWIIYFIKRIKCTQCKK